MECALTRETREGWSEDEEDDDAEDDADDEEVEEGGRKRCVSLDESSWNKLARSNEKSAGK